MTTAIVSKTLTNADRCDRCGAQAFIKATYITGDLLFCGHHGKAYMSALVETAEDVVDEGALT